MRAVLADLSTQRYVLTLAAQRLPRGLGHEAGWRPGGVLRLVDDLPEPRLPDAPGWVRLRPELSGICGSDLGLAHAKLSFVLSAFYPAVRQVPGHEVVAVVEETAAGVSRVAAGDRVAVTPLISCAQRGVERLCRACAEGHPGVCDRLDQPVAGCPGPSLGFDAELGGGWGEVAIAHETQLYPVGGIPSTRAVLAEPASIAARAVLRWQRRGERVVVIGAGTIGLLVTAALRMLHPDLDIVVLTSGSFADAAALRAGASRTLPSGRGAVAALAEADGGRLLHPRMTRTPILVDGVDAVFDAVGSANTLDLALHLLRSTGSLVLIGAAGKQAVDWSLIWARQMTILGSVNLGHEEQLGGRHAMDQVVEWLGDDKYAVDGIVTHAHALDEWRDGLRVAAAGPDAGCIKATLRPNPDVPLVGTPA